MGTETFQYTGSEQTWTVPEHIDEATVRLYGAGGGGGSDAGVGGYVEATISVTPGDDYYLYVGGGGGSGDGSGGWNGGGDGVTTGADGVTSGGGGGATDIRYGGQTVDDRLLVAGGGGGQGDDGSSIDGGDGGPNTGQDGSGFYPGEGGTQTSGGAGSENGEDGDFGTGGAGGAFSDLDSNDAAAGGGGAGWYGGGGGGAPEPNAGGGGGGSNYTDGATSVLANERGTGNAGDGLIEIEYDQEPPAPENLSLAYRSGDREITTDWDAVPAVDGYRLYVSGDPDAASSGSILAETTDTTYTELDVPDGDQRYYQVTAYVDSESPPSNGVDVLTDLPRPADVTFDSLAGRHVTLSWTDMSNNADGYRLLVREDATPPYEQHGDDIAPVGEGQRVTHESAELLDGMRYAIAVETFTADTTSRRASTIDVAAGETLTVAAGETESVNSPFAVQGTVSNSGTVDNS